MVWKEGFTSNPYRYLYPPLQGQPFTDTNNGGKVIMGEGRAYGGGSVTANVGGTLWAIWQWAGSGTPPDHLNILLTSYVDAEVEFLYPDPPFLPTGLSGTASATDSLGESEQVDSSSTAPYSQWSLGTDYNQRLVGHHLLRVPVTNVNGVWEAPVSLSGKTSMTASNQLGSSGPNGPYVDSIPVIQGTAQIFNGGSLTADSTVDTPGWDGTHPRFFSGTGCKAQGTATAVSGYVSHALLTINGTAVSEYWDTNAPGIPSSLPPYAFTGTNLTSRSLGAIFDSTHFADQIAINIQMNVWDTAGNTYSGSVSAPAYNKAYILTSHMQLFAVSCNEMRDEINGDFLGMNYSTLPSSWHHTSDIHSYLPLYTSFYISTHASDQTFGDCYDDGSDRATWVSYITNTGQSAQGDVALKSPAIPPYNFVFINGCDSAGVDGLNTFHLGAGASSFGLGQAFSDRAFLGWQTFMSGIQDDEWVSDVYNDLEGGETLYDATITASEDAGQPVGPPPGSTGIYEAGTVPISPVIVGDPLMKLHGVYLATSGDEGGYPWFRPIQ